MGCLADADNKPKIIHLRNSRKFNTAKILHQLCLHELGDIEESAEDDDRQEVANHSTGGRGRNGRVAILVGTTHTAISVI